jgi:hypothetical protein
MKQPNKKDILKKWSPILESMGMTGSKADWMSQYANSHIDNERERDNKINQILESNTDNEFPSLLPIAMKVAAQTIGQDLVSVQPMSSGMSQEEIDRINAEIKKENRDGKIDAIVEGKDYKELKPEEHPDWKPGPVGNLFYFDYQYGHKKTRRSGKKHKKKSND